MRKLSIEEATNLALDFLKKLRFNETESRYIVENIMQAELSGRKSHGLNKLLVIKKIVNNKFDVNQKYFDYINLDTDVDLVVISESSNHIYIDANYKTGFYAIGKALEIALPKAKLTSTYAVGIKNLGFASGFIGAYAQKAANSGLIYIGFHNSSGGLNYTGTKDDPLGTNPITMAFPSNPFNTIVDVSMAAMNWNDLEIARREGKELLPGKAVTKDGNETTNPKDVFAIKSIADHKGTALAYGVELLAGALTGSRVGFSQHGGWGSFFILINPSNYVGKNAFKDTVTKSNDSIKKLDAESEPFIPGEKTYKLRGNNKENGYIEIDDKLFFDLNGI